MERLAVVGLKVVVCAEPAVSETEGSVMDAAPLVTFVHFQELHHEIDRVIQFNRK